MLFYMKRKPKHNQSNVLLVYIHSTDSNAISIMATFLYSSNSILIQANVFCKQIPLAKPRALEFHIDCTKTFFRPAGFSLW